MNTNEPQVNNTAQEKLKCLACGIEFIGITNCPVDGSKLVPINPDEFIGKIIESKYEVLSKLGTGGMSVVYKARQILMDRIVAIKFLVNQDTDSLRRFQLEAKLASSLSHPNIITIFDFGIATEQGKPFIVMDYLKGISLSEIIKEKGCLPTEEAIPIFLKVIDALAYAHENSILHRDLKPANIMICEYTQDSKLDQQSSTRQLSGSSVVIDGKAYLIKLVDFGIAKLIGETDQEEYKLTKTGEVFGSPIYMSPEQFLGEKLDNRSDIYSFGVVMYETLTGCLPLIGKNLMDTLNRRLSEKVEKFSEIAPDIVINPVVEDIVLRCLERDISLRYQSMRDLQTVLEKFHTHKMNEKEVSTQKISVSSFKNLPDLSNNRVSKKPLIIVSSVIIVAIFAGVFYFYQVSNNQNSATRRKNQNQLTKINQPISPQTVNALESVDNLLATGKINDAFNILENEYTKANGDQVVQNKIISKLSLVAKAYQTIGDNTQAIKINELILKRLNLKFGYASSDKLGCLNNLIDLYKLTKNDSKVSELNQEVSIINKVVDACDNSDKFLEKARENLAQHNIAKAKNVSNLAIDQLKKASDLVGQNYKEPDLTLAVIDNKIGQFYYLQANCDKSLEFHKAASQICDSIDSTEAQLELAKADIGIGTSYFGLNNYSKAKKYFEEALSIRQNCLGENDPANIEILSCLSIVAQNEHNIVQARDYIKKAITIQTNFDPNNKELELLKRRLKKLSK